MLYPVTKVAFTRYTFPLKVPAEVQINKKKLIVKQLTFSNFNNTENIPNFELTESILNLCMACFLNHDDQIVSLIKHAKEDTKALDILQSRNFFFVSFDDKKYQLISLFEFACLRGSLQGITAIAQETQPMNRIKVLKDDNLQKRLPGIKEQMLELFFSFSLNSQDSLDSYIQNTIEYNDQVSKLCVTFLEKQLPSELPVRDIRLIIADYAKDSLFIEAFSLDAMFWSHHKKQIPAIYHECIDARVEEKNKAIIEKLEKMKLAIDKISDTDSIDYLVQIGGFYRIIFDSSIVQELSVSLKNAYQIYYSKLKEKQLLVEAATGTIENALKSKRNENESKDDK